MESSAKASTIEEIMKSYSSYEDVNLTDLSWTPQNTFAVIVSILEYEDNKTAGWDKSTRRCKNLYEMLQKMGVPNENICYLKEEEASSTKLNETLKTILNKCDTASNFIFYYAGHGGRSSNATDEEGNKIPEFHFVNWDNLTNPRASDFKLDSFRDNIIQHFNGNLLILLADCCYSGNLRRIAEEAYKVKETKAVVLTSATDLNTSTGRWTFTDCLVELLSGLPYSEYSQEFITLNFAADYIRYNMGLVNDQFCCSYFSPNVDPSKFILSENLNLRKNTNCGRSVNKMTDLSNNINELGSVIGDFEQMHINHVSDPSHTKESNDFRLGMVKYHNYKGKDYKVRIIERDNENKKCKVHWYDWDKDGSTYDTWVQDEEGLLTDIKYEVYPEGTMVEVNYLNEYFKCKVVKNDWIFHLITYDGWDEYYNEWITHHRIKRE